jgi:hypothetical protein
MAFTKDTVFQFVLPYVLPYTSMEKVQLWVMLSMINIFVKLNLKKNIIVHLINKWIFINMLMISNIILIIVKVILDNHKEYIKDNMLNKWKRKLMKNLELLINKMLN